MEFQLDIISRGNHRWRREISAVFWSQANLIAPVTYLFIPGYSTHIIGKWHLGFFRWPYTPLYRGFDSFYGFYGGYEDYYSHEYEGILDLLDNKKPVRDKSGVYSATLYAEVLTDFQIVRSL